MWFSVPIANSIPNIDMTISFDAFVGRFEKVVRISLISRSKKLLTGWSGRLGHLPSSGIGDN